ncbi:MAG: GNAT family N-acetyltransferase [Anaerolineaceae bacterium]|nr:GNAT family N-acetyltransferase [Anaerolineaceae bacterium]
MPSPIHIRPAEPPDAQAIADVQTASWRTTYAGLMPDEFLVSIDVNRRAEVWHTWLTDSSRRYCFFVAEDADGQVVGFASGGPERDGHPVYKGELSAIYILEAYHGQGIGRRLVQAVVEWLIEHHYHNMLIWVLGTNKIGIGFYEALGGQRVGSKNTEIGGETLEEIAYGWLDITPLLPP